MITDRWQQPAYQTGYRPVLSEAGTEIHYYAANKGWSSNAGNGIDCQGGGKLYQARSPTASTLSGPENSDQMWEASRGKA